ncbi:MAG: 2-oxoacid:acceptor oxidoreductase family protein [Candidatus Marinimicrobia bacterium]|nr:2-oxoacid:acceptor oxidoreductase family protein [Candidatus Neomarinimicrobiota bacterium]
MKKIKYPGLKSTSDGSAIVVWVETHITQGACAYPITPSTTMGSGYQAIVSNGGTNIWGEELAFIELESEHSAATTCEGFALAGGRVTNFTSGQGLILMKEVLYTISGKRLPIVFHIGARALTSQSLNVHAGHDDVMGVSDCGWGMMFSQNVQEAGDLALIARKTAELTSTPFFNIMDGFLTTHTIENVLLPEPELMDEYISKPQDKLVNFMDPYHPVMTGVVQNQDSYMKGKIAQRNYTDKIESILENSMNEFYELTGREYKLVTAYKLDDAEWAIIGLGSMMETTKATIDYLRKENGLKVGLLNITSFRPFPGNKIVKMLKHLKGITILERMDNPLAESNPLTMEIKSSFTDYYSHNDTNNIQIPKIYSGSAGLGSRDIRPSDIISVYNNMINNEKKYFAIGIKHELGLDSEERIDVRPEGAFSMRGHSVGGYGSVTTNKIMATIVADLFDLYVQAYPKYGSEKKGLPTTYYLTISPDPIKTHNELEFVEFVPLNDINAFNLSNPLNGLQKGGLLFVQTNKIDPKEIWSDFPNWAQNKIQKDEINVLALDMVKVAKEVSSKPDLRQRMQGIVLLGVFLQSTPYYKKSSLTEDDLMIGVEKSIRKYFGKRGEQVVQDNLNAVRRGFTEVIKVPLEIINSHQGENK